jgi:hypothetical protein
MLYPSRAVIAQRARSSSALLPATYTRSGLSDTVDHPVPHRAKDAHVLAKLLLRSGQYSPAVLALIERSSAQELILAITSVLSRPEVDTFAVDISVAVGCFGKPRSELRRGPKVLLQDVNSSIFTSM